MEKYGDHMGTLTPGATYIYERVDGVVYARESGSTDRKEIGRYNEGHSGGLVDDIRENQLWHEIRRAAKTSPALQSILDEAIMIYKLSKEYSNGI